MSLWIWVLNCTVLFFYFYSVRQKEVKIPVVDFMFSLSWHISVLPEKGRVILPLCPTPDSACLFTLPASCASPSLFDSSVN